MIRILIADDHEVVRQDLRRMIGAWPDLKVVGEVSDGLGVLEIVSRTFADVLLLDAGMPGPGAFVLIDEIKSRRPSLPIIALSIDPDENAAAALLRQGASGFLTKDHSPDELNAAIRRVSSGRRHLSPSLAQTLLEHAGADPSEPAHARLSPRELRVLVELARGAPVGRIARELGLSTHAVTADRSRVLTRLGCANLVELVRYAVEHGLVAPGPDPRSR